MKKDIEWLKNEVKSLFDKAYDLGKMKYHESEESIHRINSLIDQLDEPEVLSQEWIDEHAQGGCDEWVYTEDLENLLAPKKELPVIPKFVADYLCRAKADITLMRVMELANTRNELPKWEKEYDWISANDEKFARAWLDGYEVEKEKEYYVVLPAKGKDMYLNYDVQENVNFDDYKGTRFTEAEIKAIDERYWAFAEEETK